MVSRYARAIKIRGGRQLGTSVVHSTIKKAVDDGSLRVRESVLQEGERLDTIAGQAYGDGTLWWVVAAASGIGWGLQVPPGTLISVPVSIDDVIRLVA